MVECDRLGRTKPGRVKKLGLDEKGYARATLCQPGGGKCRNCAVHRLIALSFIPNPHHLPEVNHIDANRSNNRSSNLEWVTHAENIQHSNRLGRYAESYRKSRGAGSSCFKGIVLVYDVDGNLIDTLVGSTDMEKKGYRSACVSTCLKHPGRTHRGFTYVRQPPTPKSP